MLYPALLLNNNHEVLSFITDRRSIKFILSESVDILSTWDDSFSYYNQTINFPAVLRLKYLIKRPRPNVIFSRAAVFKRDDLKCQYCSKSLRTDLMTIDHVIPKIKGGSNRSFTNCVAACYVCNNRKGGRTPEEAGMKLLKQPVVPVIGSVKKIEDVTTWHSDWNYYL